MSTDLETLNLAVNSSELVRATSDLDKFVNSGTKAEATANDIGESFDKTTQAATRQRDALDKLLGKIDPVTKKLNDLAKQERDLADAHKSGAITGEAYTTYQKKIDAALNSMLGLTAAQKTAVETHEQAAARILQVARAAVEAKQAQIDMSNAVIENAKNANVNSAAVSKMANEVDKAAVKNAGLAAANDKTAASSKKVASAFDQQDKELRELMGAIDPIGKKINDLDDQQEKLFQHMKTGRISPEVWADYKEKIDVTRANLGRFDDSLTRTGNTAKQTAAAMRGVPAQFTDIFVSLQGGQAPLTVLLQQGGQLKDMFGGIGPAARAMGGYIAGLVNPYTIAAAAVGALAIAYYQGSKEQDAFRVALVTTGNVSGTTTGQMASMAKAVGSTVGTTGAAAEALTLLASTGKFTSASFEQIATSALLFEKATGKAASETIAEFVKIADSPVKAIGELDDKYHFLTASIYEQIYALEEQGNKQGAAILAENAYSDALESRSNKIKENLGYVQTAWNAIAGGAKKAWDAMLDVGREKTLEEKLVELDEKLALIRGAKTNPLILGDNPDLVMLAGGDEEIERQRTDLLAASDEEKSRAAAVGRTNAAIAQGRKDYDDVKAAVKDLRSNEQKRTDELLANERKIANIRKQGYKLSAEDEANLKQGILDKYKDKAKPKGAATPIDYTVFNNAENELKAITSKFDNSLKELEALQKNGLISQEEYSLKKVALITKEKDDTNSAYLAEITALEEIKGRRTTNANERIQLDQKIADARTNMAKATEQAESKLKVSAAEEEGRLKKQTEAVNAYKGALDAQLEALQQQGVRNAASVGMGSSQKAIFDQISALTDKLNTQRLQLASQYGDGSRGMSLDEYNQKLRDLEANHTAMTDQVVVNYQQLKVAQSDWTNGAKSAFQDYIDSANDIAGQTKQAFSNAFTGLEDIFTKFITTGKLSFKEFADSIIADLARIVVKQQIIAPLMSAFFGGNNGGGSTSFGGAVGSMLGGSNSGSDSTGWGGMINLGKNLYSAWSNLTGVGSSIASGYASGGISGAISGGAGYYGSMLTNLGTTLAGGFNSIVGAVTGQTAAQAATAAANAATSAALQSAVTEGAVNIGANLGVGGVAAEGAAAGAGAGSSGVLASMGAMWPLAVIMGMYQSGKLYDAGVRPDAGEIRDSAGSTTLGKVAMAPGAAMSGFFEAQDKALSKVVGGKWAAILSGSTLHQAVTKMVGEKLFGTSYQTKDTGIALGVEGGVFDAQSYQDQKKKGGWLSGKSKSRTLYGALPTETMDVLGAAYNDTILQVGGLFSTLGVELHDSVLDGLNMAEFKISTKDKTQQEVQTQLDAWFAALAHQAVFAISEATNAGLSGFTFEGLKVFVQNLKDVNDVIRYLNVGLFDMSVKGGFMAEQLTAMAGGLENLTKVASTYYESFHTDTEKATDLLDAVNRQFAAMGLSLPATRQGFRSAVEAIDITTESGRQMFLTLTGLAGSAAQAYTVLEQRAADAQAAYANNINSQMALIQRSVKAEQDKLTAQYNAATASISDMSETAQKNVSDLTAMGNALSSALDQIIQSSEQATAVLRSQAKSILDSALASARSGKSVANFEGLSDALKTLSTNDTSNYESLESYLRDQGQTANKIEELNILNGKQLTTEQQIVKGLANQLEQLKYDYEASMQYYTNALAYAQAQVDALNGVDNSVRSVQLAIAQLSGLIAGALATKPEGSAAANTLQNNESILGNVYTTVLGRAPDAEGLAYWGNLLQTGQIDYAGLVAGIAKDAKANGEGTMPGFATGGNHSGGWMTVGERGPEQVYTSGPATIMNHAESRRMIKNGDNSELVSQIRLLTDIVSEQGDYLYQVAKNTGTSANRLTDINEREERAEV